MLRQYIHRVNFPNEYLNFAGFSPKLDLPLCNCRLFLRNLDTILINSLTLSLVEMTFCSSAEVPS